MKVIVVGAGTAGLLVTRELRARGFDVLTLEKDPTPAGASPAPSATAT